jgi:hypothetical protein
LKQESLFPLSLELFAPPTAQVLETPRGRLQEHITHLFDPSALLPDIFVPSHTRPRPHHFSLNKSIVRVPLALYGRRRALQLSNYSCSTPNVSIRLTNPAPLPSPLRVPPLSHHSLFRTARTTARLYNPSHTVDYTFSKTQTLLSAFLSVFSPSLASSSRRCPHLWPANPPNLYFLALSSTYDHFSRSSDLVGRSPRISTSSCQQRRGVFPLVLAPPLPRRRLTFLPSTASATVSHGED